MMNRQFLLACLFLSNSFCLLAQTTNNFEQPLSIGTAAPNASALLDLQATDKGMLVPRMTSAQRNAITSPATGLLVYDTDAKSFYYRSNIAWVSLEVQTLSIQGNSINLSNNGGTILLGSGLTTAGQSISAADPSTTNEIQTLSLVGDDLSISAGNTVSLYGVNLLGDCGTARTCFGNDSAGDLTLGIGTCPDNTARLYVKDTDSDSRSGVKVELTGGVNINRKGIDLRVENGSNTNDGIVMLVGGNNNANGMTGTVTSNNSLTGLATGINLTVSNGNKNFGLNIVADDNTANNPSGGQNIGLKAEAKDNTTNNSINESLRDFALWAIAENKSADYAAWFDGNLGVPNEIRFINPTSNNDWGVSIIKTAGAVCGGVSNINDLVFKYEGVVKAVINETDGAYCNTSDQRLKENIAHLPALLPLALQLNPVTYNFRDDESKAPSIGFIAQDVARLFPEVIHRIPDEKLGEILTLNYDAFSVIAIKSIQEQQAVIAQQQERLGQLEKEMAEMKAMIKAMER